MFIAGRKILDQVLIVNEANRLDYRERKNKECVICKIDFEKAFFLFFNKKQVVLSLLWKYIPF